MLQLLYITEIPICEYGTVRRVPTFISSGRAPSNANFHPPALNRTPNRALESCAILALLCIAAKRLAATRNVTTIRCIFFSFSSSSSSSLSLSFFRAFNPFAPLFFSLSNFLSCTNPSVSPYRLFSLSAVVGLINKIVYSINEVHNNVTAMNVLLTILMIAN